MKPNIKHAGMVATLLAVIGLSGLMTGCQTGSGSNDPNGTNYSTLNTNLSVFADPIKLEQAENALEPVAAGAVRRVLKNSPQHAQEIGSYVRAVGGVFCAMKTGGDFRPEYLLDQADKIATPLLEDDEIIDAKNGIIALYKIFYGDRFKAEIPADQWMGKVCELVCNSLNQGLKDAGQPGI